ncbi:MAG: hypothetical protein IPL32_20425 [Chloracidobacterium sp.]|nr:hypothetical protein [Chloracidobacterium sp.]
MSDNYQATFAAPLTRAELVADNLYIPQFEFLQESDAPYGIKVGRDVGMTVHISQIQVLRFIGRRCHKRGRAPTAVVVENTLGGTLVWTRNSIGSYRATLTGAFPDDTKVLLFATYGSNVGSYETDGVLLSWQWSHANYILLESNNLTVGTYADLNANNCSVEILVYPQEKLCHKKSFRKISRSTANRVVGVR